MHRPTRLNIPTALVMGTGVGDGMEGAFAMKKFHCV